jgi:hypothetical protein
MITIIVLIIVSIIAILEFIYLVKNKKEKISLKINVDSLNAKMIDFKNILVEDKKIGYYNLVWAYENKPIKFNVFVEELDRYTNGDCKTKIDHIEILQCPVDVRHNVVSKIEKQFSTIKDPSKITWLVSENAIKELRKKKLEALEKLIN